MRASESDSDAQLLPKQTLLRRDGGSSIVAEDEAGGGNSEVRMHLLDLSVRG